MSDQRQVYIDFVDGNGYIDVSNFVKYDTLTIQEAAFNDTYHAAQNTCSFSIIYDASIYTKLVSAVKNLPLRIYDLRENASLCTEDGHPILTEDGIRILIESSVAVPVFAGHIPPKSSRGYNGILNNTIIKINATDNLDYMDIPAGDIIYANCAVMNPADPANSIVHKLALAAGWTSSMVSNVSIPTVIPRFAPPEEDTSIRSILDTLLYEYGYTLFLDENNNIAPIQWNVAIPSGTIPEFNEDNIIDEVSIEQSINKYDGVKVVYYEMNSIEHMRLYRDSNCGYASDGTFAGYSILNNTDYPPAANAIDETTGDRQIVYQEYTDDAIKYATNKAIQQNLDYNYKNYSSDFTSIVATENHYVDRRFEHPITVVAETFGNKKCRLLYRNNTGSPVLLYFNDVYATIWYKSAERTAIKNLVTTPSDVYSYTSSYIYNKTIGDDLTLALAAQYKAGLKNYEMPSETALACGTLVKLVLVGEGTDVYALIKNRSWDEQNGLYTYTCVAYNPIRETLTSQTVVDVGAINSSESYASIHKIGTPEAMQTSVVAYTPKYLGIGVLAGDSVATFIGATVDNSGVITVGSTVTPNKGDYMVNYAATNVAVGMYVWDGSVWEVTSNVEYTSAASIDLCNLQVGGITITGFTTFITAIVKTLFAQQMKLLTGGKLYSGTGAYNNANTPVYIGADGKMSLGTGLVWDGSSLSIAGTVNATEGHFSGGLGDSIVLDYSELTDSWLIRQEGPFMIWFREETDFNVGTPAQYTEATYIDGAMCYGFTTYGISEYPQKRISILRIKDVSIDSDPLVKCISIFSFANNVEFLSYKCKGTAPTRVVAVYLKI